MIALALFLALAACSEGVEVEVRQGAAGTSFATAPAKAGFDACIDRAYLYAEGEKPRQLWYATRGMANTPCVREVRLAANPEGFSADAPPALKAGERYRVELIGKGFTAATVFAGR
ncbi:hypothetical protein [Sphingomonas sp. Y38-1Y]|uniref:hypothetical protein n=1 Tax=Sphingomonas sp. Y38-1Y TaxID=3078265 RepID=UPI0028E4B92C|nr:hypothetical protein [Sphingomonas sp. Y38-1Y]